MQGNNLLDVLKKKMRQTKEEMEKYKEESEDMARKLQVEIRRREEVRPVTGCPTWHLHTATAPTIRTIGVCGFPSGCRHQEPRHQLVLPPEPWPGMSQSWGRFVAAAWTGGGHVALILPTAP